VAFIASKLKLKLNKERERRNKKGYIGYTIKLEANAIINRNRYKRPGD
jgi:hypothetical protein